MTGQTTAVIFHQQVDFDCLCSGLMTSQPLWVSLCCLPDKGRKEIEETVEEMKERDRENRGKGIKVKKQKKLELVFVKHYAPNCLTLTLLDSNTACT